MLAQLFEITEKFNMATQPPLLLLQKQWSLLRVLQENFIQRQIFGKYQNLFWKIGLRNVKSPKASINTVLNTSSEIMKRIPNFPLLMDKAEYALKLWQKEN